VKTVPPGAVRPSIRQQSWPIRAQLGSSQSLGLVVNTPGIFDQAQMSLKWQLWVISSYQQFNIKKGHRLLTQYFKCTLRVILDMCGIIQRKGCISLCVYACACMRACVRVCVRACVCVCVWVERDSSDVMWLMWLIVEANRNKAAQSNRLFNKKQIEASMETA